MRQVFSIGEGQDLALGRAQAGEGFADAGGVAERVQQAFGGIAFTWRIRSRQRVRMQALGHPMAAQPAQAVDRAAPGQGLQPGHHGAALGTVGRGLLPDLQEDVRDDFLGIARIAQHPQGDRVDPAEGEVVQAAEGLGIAEPEAGDQRDELGFERLDGGLAARVDDGQSRFPGDDAPGIG